MPKKLAIELRCIKNADGTYNGGIWDDGNSVGDPDLIIQNGRCEDMKELWRRANERYKKGPVIVGACIECFDAQFFEEQEKYPDEDEDGKLS